MPIIAHSYFSLRYGTVSPEDILLHAKEKDFLGMCLADVVNTSAAMDFVRLSGKHGVRPLLGVDFRNGAERQFTAIAQNNNGWAQICRFLSELNNRGSEAPPSAPEWKDVWVVYPFSLWEKKGDTRLRPNERIGVSPSEVNRFRFSAWARRPEECTALLTFSFRDKKDFNTHRLLRAIENNTLLSKLHPSEQAPETDRWMSPGEIETAYAEVPELLAQSRQIMDECGVDFRFGPNEPHRNRQLFSESAENDMALIRQLCEAGIPYRYAEPPPGIRERLEMELAIISEKGYLAYFLIAHDLCAYARSKGYYYVGRGSGANSLAAYLLRITDVDPIELDLYFERFINLYRQNPPDFDLDFSWADREDITDYLFSRYRNVCLLAAYGTFQYRAAIRELGKVFGLTNAEMDRLASGRFRSDELDELSRLTLKYSAYIQDFPNILSIHAGGVLITEQPIEEVSATFLPPKGYPTVMFDMVVAEDVGIYKFDILSQRGLGKIKDALALVAQNQPEARVEDIRNIGRFKEDEHIKELLMSARAIGCFYVESPAMRMLLTKLRVDDYLGLVAASSVIRPGVARSGMMRQFILRHRQPEKRNEAPKALLELMPETYGVMVYQEDVIKVAHRFAGLDLGEADVLRRGMSGKFRSRAEFDKARESFFEKAQAKGHEPALVAEVWRQIESFAGYAFAKGHSASYAVESYQSLYLKAYFPLEYMVATLNNGGGFYSPELYVHEARLCGGIVHPPCVNRSGALARIYGRDIFLGLGMIKGIEEGTMERILMAREAEGPFASLADFAVRTSTGREQLVLLVRAGALGYTGIDKKELLWAAHAHTGRKRKENETVPLFRPKSKDFKLPELRTDFLEEAYDQMELLGFALCSPFDLLSEPMPDHLRAADLPSKIGEVVVTVGYLVTVKNTRTADGKLMQFGTFLDAEGQWLDTVHFPPVASRFPLRGRGIYSIKGRVSEEFGAISVDVEGLEKLAIKGVER